MAETLARRPPLAYSTSELDALSDTEGSSDDEEHELDTTAKQYAAGKDIQGIQWQNLHFTREQYRSTRISSYSTYVNMERETAAGLESLDKMQQLCGKVGMGNNWYNFCHNSRGVHSTVVHFQLRNLLWATSANDVYVMLDNAINHWSPLTREVTRVLSLSGISPSGRIQVATTTAGCGLLAAGGFTGELAVQSLCTKQAMTMERITDDENGITNGLEAFMSRSGGTNIMASNNDSMLRVFDAGTASLKCISKVGFPWAVNYASVQPGGGTLTAVVGDSPEARLLDWSTGKPVAALQGHYDYSFAVAWHPDGRLIATGNQDSSARVWDVRMVGGGSVAVLRARMGAIRSLRFSPSGGYLAMAEPADFVTLFDVASGFQEAQEIDLFGEVAGISFSPDSERLFISIADLTYSSLLEFHLNDKFRDFAGHVRDTAD